VIVVIGELHAAGGGADVAPAGLAGAVALAAAGAGARVELVTRIGDDPTGDALLLAVAAAGVGHVATLRDAAHATMVAAMPEEPVDLDDEPAGSAEQATADPSPVPDAPTLDGADVGLALRYLPEYRVVVAAHPSPAVLTEAIAAARWAGAHLVVALDPATDATPPAEAPDDALVLAVDGDADGLGDALGRYAAAVDAGGAPAEAFATTLGAGEPVGPEA
jgi:sugar/nucleoside kinase (ribokinase family)